MKEMSDTEILQCLHSSQDSTACFNELYRRFAHLIFGAAYKSIPDEDICTDITHDILLKIKKHTGTIDNLSAFLYRSTKNAVIDKIRTKSQIPDMVTIDNNERFSEENDSMIVTNTTDKRLILEEKEAVIAALLNNLSPIVCQCSTYRFYDGCSYQEIAQKLNISPDDVRNHLQTARRYLRTHLLH